MLSSRLTWTALAAERWARRVEELAARAAARCVAAPVDLRSPLGHALPARLHHPRGDGPFPGVLLCSGGVDGIQGGEGLSPVLTAPRLAREGFAALAFGVSGREGVPGPEDRNGPLHQEEAAAALAMLLAHPRVDPSRVVVVSISFGLVQAAGALVRHPELAARVRRFVDWEGPPSRRWFHVRRLQFWTQDEAWWADREAVQLLPRVACPYWRYQSRWDHVHGPVADLGREAALAASTGVSPEVRLNGQGFPFDAPGGPVSLRAQSDELVGWVRDAIG